MEGVQIYDKYVNDNLTATYMNMNGTWTDVTGRINVTRPPQKEGRYVATGVIVHETDWFSSNFSSGHDFDSNGREADQNYGPYQNINHLVGEGFFDNNWAAHQSRLFVMCGSWNASEPHADPKAIEALQSGNLTFRTQVENYANEGNYFVNNTVTMTRSEAFELKQVHLTHSGNSYLYNPLVINEKTLQLDKWGIEATIKLRS